MRTKLRAGKSIGGKLLNVQRMSTLTQGGFIRR